MSPDEVTECQVKLDRITAEFDRPCLVGKVRQHAGWTDPETGEKYPPIWVAEVRLRSGDEMRVVTLDIEIWRDEAWDEIARHEVEMLL